jgi:hypothetical protein
MSASRFSSLLPSLPCVQKFIWTAAQKHAQHLLTRDGVRWLTSLRWWCSAVARQCGDNPRRPSIPMHKMHNVHLADSSQGQMRQRFHAGNSDSKKGAQRA